MLLNKTILITGGGSGIGEALAKNLSKNNKIIICGRNEDKLKKVATENSNVSYFITDLTNPFEIENLFRKLAENHIILDVLINNAGVVELWDIVTTKLTSSEIFAKVNTNLSGAIAVTQYFINQANPVKENIIINNTSEIAIMPVPLLLIYSASKSGLSVFTKLLRVQLKKTKFKVIELLTPSVDTDMPKQLNNKGKLISPDEFANKAIKSITKGKTEYAPGPNVFLFKFFQRFLPKTGMNLIDKLSRKQLLGK